MNMKNYLFCSLVTMASGLGYMAPVSSEVKLLSISPSEPSTQHSVIFEFDSLCSTNEGIKKVHLDHDSRQVKVAFITSGFSCPKTEPMMLGPFFQSGVWEVSLFAHGLVEPIDPFDPSLQVFSGFVTVKGHLGDESSSHEVPSQNSTVSGVGVIRGWACDAMRIQVVIDDGDPIELAYGTSREDTREICGDANNGYGMVIAWGLLGQGMHRMQTYLNGFEISDVEFEVTGFTEPFIKGLSGKYALEDFPFLDESVTIEWSEPDQNFQIINHLD